jgi:RNA polymerase sigma-70 factor (ECF subfamily)
MAADDHARWATWCALRPGDHREAALARLDALHARAAAAWPRLTLPDDAWLPYLAARLPADGGADTADALQIEDLWLACACLAGAPAALDAFDRAHRPALRAAAAGVTPPGATVDDVLQLAYAKLLVGDPARPPALARYAGRGSLAGWLKVTVVRLALDLHRAGGREVPLNDEVIAWPDPAVDPGLAALRARYAGDFKDAFAQAMATLTARDRNVLRGQVLYQMTLDQLAAVHRVHRSAVARWLADARATLLIATREALTARIGATRAEVESLIAALHSQLDVSLERLLAPDAE